MPLSSVVGASSILRPGVCTSTSRPASPFEGQTIYETDTDVMLVSNGSAWRAFADVGSSVNGNIIQVVSTTKTDTFSASLAAGANSNITGLNASITPTSSTNKILIIAQTNGAIDTNFVFNGFRLVRGTTEIALGDTASNRTRVTAGGVSNANHGADMMTTTINFLDSPATTSSTTYHVRIINPASASRTVYVNRSSLDTDSSEYLRATSTITLMEVSA